MTVKRIVVGTRGSRLALIQTGAVVHLLKRARPGLEIEVEPVVTAGDKDRHSHIEQMGVDVFVKELEEALLNGKIDIAVHSLKDMPTELPDGLCLLATPERENPADVLVSLAGGLQVLPAGARIGTGSLRRSAQLTAFRPDLVPVPVRGNIETRLRKVADGEVDGVILAAAALIRLGLLEKTTGLLPLDTFLPAAGQGALVIEGRKNDEALVELVAPVNHKATWHCVTAERMFLQTFGGGCRAPIGVLGAVHETDLILQAMVLSENGSRIQRASRRGTAATALETGAELAKEMLAAGAGEILEGCGRL